MAEIRAPKAFNNLTAITSIDGRFRGRVEGMAKYFSEFATISGRVFVEIEYLIAFLAEIKKPIPASDQKKLRKFAMDFSEREALLVWKKDEEINHDTKAVEYFLQNKLKEVKLGHLINYLHFGLTSTDIDNTGLALSLKDFSKEIFIPTVEKLTVVLKEMAGEQKDLVMLARTHGQVAVPTTAGKELANFYSRLSAQLEKFKNIKLGSKMTGAVGNFNALEAAYPEIDWPKFSKKLLNSLGLESYSHTTQVEPYDHKVEWLQAIKRINLVVVAMCEDIWRYLALGYLSMRDEKGHVGSSTMPQKINPIGFEMGESYTSLANGILEVLEKKLPLNRWQRDLTDKYLLRDVGQALAMSVLAYESVTEALERVGFNGKVVSQDLNNHWECIAEGVQTILRSAGVENAYEKLKELTRGKKVTKEDYEKFIEGIEVPSKTKAKLRQLSPQNYVGLARKLAIL